MTAHLCTAERFVRDVEGHQMTVLRADGVNRHLRFRKPGDSSYWFDLVTWPGALCIDGDCGTYVFKRLEDMFQFFRDDGGRINPGYWAEKVQAEARHGGVEEFDQAAFVRHTVADYRRYWRDRGQWSEQLEGFKELRMDVLGAESEANMYSALSAFRWKGFEFRDFWEWSPRRYTFRFIWNLRAIVWGIQQWDALQQQGQAA
jgi:hypothetical protein